MLDTKDNELIAQFMGVVFHDDEDMYYSSDGLYIGKNLLYDKSWDWLMPVVEKIESLDNGVIIEISGSYTIANGVDQTYYLEYRGDTKLLNTYKAVVELIKWYNQDKNKMETGGQATTWGGSTGALNIPQLSFSKVDYDVNVYRSNMEVDVNIKEYDSVDYSALNDTDAEWTQYSWGYMVYPKSVDQLYEVLKALRTKVSKSRLKSYFSDGTYETGGQVEYEDEYIEYLNEVGVPEDDHPENDGRVSWDMVDNYGEWLRDNDPIAFNVGVQEYTTEQEQKMKTGGRVTAKSNKMTDKERAIHERIVKSKNIGADVRAESQAKLDAAKSPKKKSAPKAKAKKSAPKKAAPKKAAAKKPAKRKTGKGSMAGLNKYNAFRAKMKKEGHTEKEMSALWKAEKSGKAPAKAKKKVSAPKRPAKKATPKAKRKVKAPKKWGKNQGNPNLQAKMRKAGKWGKTKTVSRADHQTGVNAKEKHDPKKDKSLSPAAHHAGKRKTAWGTTYWEARKNRSDVDKRKRI